MYIPLIKVVDFIIILKTEKSHLKKYYDGTAWVRLFQPS